MTDLPFKGGWGAVEGEGGKELKTLNNPHLLYFSINTLIRKPLASQAQAPQSPHTLKVAAGLPPAPKMEGLSAGLAVHVFKWGNRQVAKIYINEGIVCSKGDWYV